MKANTIVKKATLAALAFLFWNTTTAQNMYQYASIGCTSTYTETIIRGVTANTFIHCQHVNTSSEFILVNVSSLYSPSGTKFALPTNLIVNDFVVEDDDVYFCGYDNSLSQGIVGRFPLSNFSNITGTVTYATVPATDTNYFNSIKTYTDPNSNRKKAAAIGFVPGSNGVPNKSSVCIFDFSSTTVTCNYYGFAQGNDYYYPFQDLDVTSNFIAIIGAINSNSAFLCKIPKSNTSQMTYYPISNNVGYNSSCHIEALSNDRIAFCSLGMVSSPTTSYVTSVYTYDLSSSIPACLNVQDIPLYNPGDADDLLYIRDNGDLLLLQTTPVAPSGNAYPVIYTLNPLSSNYNSTLIYSTDHKLTTLGRLTNLHYLIGGIDPYKNHCFIVRFNNGTVPYYCLKNGTVFVTHNSSKASTPNTFNLSKKNYSLTTVPVSIYGENMTWKCSDE